MLASLKIIGRLHWIDREKLRSFILACQDEETGGFADRPGDMASIFVTVYLTVKIFSVALCSKGSKFPELGIGGWGERMVFPSVALKGCFLNNCHLRIYERSKTSLQKFLVTYCQEMSEIGRAHV